MFDIGRREYALRGVVEKPMLSAALLLLSSSIAPLARSFVLETTPAIETHESAPQIVTLNSNDGSKGIDNEKGKVTIQQAGSYFLMAAGQIGGTGKGTVRLWMRQSGKDVDNSNTIQAIEGGGFTAVLVCQGVVEAKAGDKLELLFSASASDQGLGYLLLKYNGDLNTAMSFAAIISLAVLGVLLYVCVELLEGLLVQRRMSTGVHANA